MLHKLSSLISTYVSPYVLSAADYVQARPVESLAVALGVVVLVLTLIVVFGSTWQPDAESELADGTEHDVDTGPDELGPLAAMEPMTGFVLPPASPAPVLRAVLASVQDVLPGTPMRFAPEVALPGWASHVSPPAADELRSAPRIPEQDPHPAPEFDAAPTPSDAAAPLAPVPALFSAFAELSQLSSGSRQSGHAGGREDGAA